MSKIDVIEVGRVNAERKRVSADWNDKIDVRSSLEYENAYDEMFEVDELFEEIEDQICSAGLPGTGYVSIRENIRQSWENHQALEAFTVSLTDYMDSKLDRPFASGLNKGAVHTLSLIKMEDFKTYKTGNLGHGYYDHGNLYSNQGSGYALTFQDFLGIAGNGAEDEAEYMGGQVTVNDNYVRSFAEVYKKQYETFGDKSVTLEEYLNELYSSGEFVHKRDQPVNEFLSSLLDMAPVAGSVKNFIEMGIGKDIITGDELTQTEQRTKTLRMLADVVAMEFALGDIGTALEVKAARKAEDQIVLNKIDGDEVLKVRGGSKTTGYYVGSNGKALPSQYKDWIGTNMQEELLSQAENPQLQNAIKQLYRGKSFIGDGGTADVIRFEQETGIMLGKNGGSHVQKGIDMASYIQNKILTQNLSDTDRALAIKLLDDLNNVLGRR